MQDSTGEQNIAFIFDVDGTLTPSRNLIDRQFAVWFSKFCNANDVYLVTGSDKQKTVQQIGNSLYLLAKRVYNCNGSEVWEKQTLVRQDKIPDSIHLQNMYSDLLKKLDFSPYPIRTGKHIEYRECMINFSILGRNANMEQRKEYVKYDTMYNERSKLCKELTRLHGDHFDFLVAGEIGIDIVEKGKDKSQILKDFDKKYVMFFGDKTEEGGNDYPLKKAILDRGYGTTHKVVNWQDTWRILAADAWRMTQNDSRKNMGLD